MSGKIYRIPKIEWQCSASDKTYRCYSFSTRIAYLNVSRMYDDDAQCWGNWCASVTYDERNSTRKSFKTLREAKAFCEKGYRKQLASCLEEVKNHPTAKGATDGD